jgi:hypothetical protein
MTTNCAIYNFFLIQNEIFQCVNYDPKIIKTIMNFLTTFYRSEGIEMIWSKKFHCPTEEEILSCFLEKKLVAIQG